MDITRIRRSVRAPGFNGSAFEDLLGSVRHRWMKSLGNKFILTGMGPPIQIAEPASASELLDLAVASQTEKRRILFFCSCKSPRWKGGRCHRTEIAALIVKAAKHRKLPVHVSEWPGGQPKRLDLELRPDVFEDIRNGRKTIPLAKPVDLPMMASLPWCSIATLHSGHEEIQTSLLVIIHDTIQKLKAAISAWISSRQTAEAASAEEKAKKAEEMAQKTHAPSEADTYRAVAKAWREAADQLRQQNEQLRAQLDGMLDKAASEIRDKLAAFDVAGVIQESDDGTLVLPSSGTVLKLPEPTENS